MEYIQARVKIEIWRKKLLGNYLVLIKTKTFTPSEDFYITDYSLGIFGIYFSVNFQGII